MFLETTLVNSLVHQDGHKLTSLVFGALYIWEETLPPPLKTSVTRGQVLVDMSAVAHSLCYLD